MYKLANQCSQAFSSCCWELLLYQMCQQFLLCCTHVGGEGCLHFLTSSSIEWSLLLYCHVHVNQSTSPGNRKKRLQGPLFMQFWLTRQCYWCIVKQWCDRCSSMKSLCLAGWSIQIHLQEGLLFISDWLGQRQLHSVGQHCSWCASCAGKCWKGRWKEKAALHFFHSCHV